MYSFYFLLETMRRVRSVASIRKLKECALVCLLVLENYFHYLAFISVSYRLIHHIVFMPVIPDSVVRNKENIIGIGERRKTKSCDRCAEGKRINSILKNRKIQHWR